MDVFGQTVVVKELDLPIRSYMPDVKELASSWGSTPPGMESGFRKSESLWETERTVLKRSASVAERAAMFQRGASDVESSPTGDEKLRSREEVVRRSGDDGRTQRRSQEVAYRRVPGSPSVQEMARVFSKRGWSEDRNSSRARSNLRDSQLILEQFQNGESSSLRVMTDPLTSEGFSSGETRSHVQDGVNRELYGGHSRDIDISRESFPNRLSLPVKLARGMSGSSFQGRHQAMASSSTDGDTSVDSTPCRVDGEMESRTSSVASPFTSTDGGSTSGGGGEGCGAMRPKSVDSGTASAMTSVMSTVSARASIPFGASALSKHLPNNGRGRPRGLRPRTSPLSSGSSNRISLPSKLSNLSVSSVGGIIPTRFESNVCETAQGERIVLGVAEQVAPGVPIAVVVRAAVKIESVMRVLIARGYVRRKLVSEVTAFSLIMERGIEVIKVREKLRIFKTEKLVSPLQCVPLSTCRFWDVQVCNRLVMKKNIPP